MILLDKTHIPLLNFMLHEIELAMAHEYGLATLYPISWTEESGRKPYDITEENYKILIEKIEAGGFPAGYYEIRDMIKNLGG